MTTVDEELLLNEPVTSEYDNSALIDEDLLLGAGDITRNKSELDESALLDSVEPLPVSEQDPAPEDDDDNVLDQTHEHEHDDEEDVHGGVESDKEELDYDEEEDDDDRRERTSRYTSEKKGGARVNSEDSEDSKKENGGKNGKPGIPSLFDKTITNAPLKNGDKLIGVILRIEGEPERVFYPPPSFMASINNPQTPIVPRLPNGIPLIGMPPNHGRAGFGMGYQQQSRLVGGGGIGGPIQNPAQWENEVAQFMNQVNKSSRGRVAGKKRRSSSYSSASSYSSDSRSRSRSSSRDRRRDEKRRRRDHREVRSYRREERRDDRRDDRDRRRHDDRKRERDSYRDNRDNRDSERDTKRRKEASKASTMESAKALGLSSDYINQMNEQKRKREEIVRKKEERRHGAPVDKKENTSAPAPSATSSAALAKDKQKAFLAVNVSGVQQVPTAKIEEMAKKIGPLRKCWRSTDDVVTIIFMAHDKAKEFMIQTNGKVQAGVRLTVTLEKKFLNASEVA